MNNKTLIMSRLIFLFAFFISVYSHAQWNVVESNKDFQLLVSTAQGDVAIYKNVPCEIKLISLNNKKVRISSSNSKIEETNELGTYRINSSENFANIQVYSSKRGNMKLIKELNLLSKQIPDFNELFITENSLYLGYSKEVFSSEMNLSPYDYQVSLLTKVVGSWVLECEKVNKAIYGYSNFLTPEAVSFIKCLPEGIEYSIRATSIELDEFYQYLTVTKSFISTNVESPAAKYVVLQNTPENRSFFDPNDPTSLIGFLNNNFLNEANLSKGQFFDLKYKGDGEFIGSQALISGLNQDAIDRLFKGKLPNGFNWVQEYGVDKRAKFVMQDNEIVPVFIKRGSIPEVKQYFNRDLLIETVDTETETVDPFEAEMIPGTEDPYPVEFRVINQKFAYTTDNISRIIIRYDSTMNLNNGEIEVLPSRISLARNFGKDNRDYIVFSILIKDLLHLDKFSYNQTFFAPTVHLRNDKNNSIYFDCEKLNSLLGTIKEQKIASFPYLEKGHTSLFGDDCDPKGKIDGILALQIEEIDGFKNEKVIFQDGNIFPVYVKKGIDPTLKIYDSSSQEMEILDSQTETLDPTEAEIIPGTIDPYPVEYRLKYQKKEQFYGITDLFIKRQYKTDPILGISIAKPTHLGFAQQFPNQNRPTLIMVVSLLDYPQLLSKLPKLEPSIFITQPWIQSILLNEVENHGENVDGNDIQTLQQKFHFINELVNINGETKVSDKPHF
jgi:hypothetical protein